MVLHTLPPDCDIFSVPISVKFCIGKKSWNRHWKNLLPEKVSVSVSFNILGAVPQSIVSVFNHYEQGSGKSIPMPEIFLEAVSFAPRDPGEIPRVLEISLESLGEISRRYITQ